MVSLPVDESAHRWLLELVFASFLVQGFALLDLILVSVAACLGVTLIIVH